MASANQEWLRTTRILEGLPDAVVAAARDGRILFVNALAEELFGYRREELVGKPVQTLWPERLRERYTRNMDLYFATHGSLRFSTEAWGLRRDGSEFAGEMSWGIVDTAAGPLLLAIGRDVSRRLTAEARLRAVAAMSERALAGADLADVAAEGVDLLRSSLAISGAEARLADGVVLTSQGRVTHESMRLPIGTGDELLLTVRSELDDDEMGLVHAVANTLATALARRRGEERMRYEALHDPLTGLPNRTLLRDRLEHALARSERESATTAALFIDLDSFKRINDAFGHRAGDAVLVELAGRLQRSVRAADTVARLGGDEFVVICEEIDRELALTLGNRLQEAIRPPVTVEGVAHSLSASIGIALSCTHPNALLESADAAVYRAKAQGGGRVELFT
jgi:diguanylate cyclase (GGDEF)-like protein/PAS domain S-box-containing protein